VLVIPPDEGVHLRVRLRARAYWDLVLGVSEGVRADFLHLK
jgi:hypothetical protein